MAELSLAPAFISFQQELFGGFVVFSAAGLAYYHLYLFPFSSRMAELSLASAGDDIRLWDAAALTLKRQFNPHSASISCIAWANDNTVSFSGKKPPNIS